jgi:alkylation response protein AidB-like acyl-CoA dehydrogenase
MYRAPIRELRFVLEELLDASALSRYPAFCDYSADTGDAILGEAARFAQEVLEPINQSGDREGARWTPAGVVTPSGFVAAYRQFVEAGWPQLGADAKYGGQPVPQVLGTAVREMWGAANLAFKLCPMLTQGAIEALAHCGTASQKALFLPKMVSGEWTGTMVLTEPQAGSDLAQIRTRAIPEGEHYRLFGQKIFITWGDHDCTENIIHMVLARIEGAPAGVRGISLFIVPKVLVAADGSLGKPNEVRCASIERKLGIHASPTCVLDFGGEKGAVGYLIGAANKGLEYMFIMMNAARLAVGLEGYAVAERSFQRALAWAQNRVQGRTPASAAGGAPTTILGHPDVKRMLLTMKSSVQAMRALALYTAYELDIATHETDEPRRARAQARVDLLIPIVKGWCTEFGNELAGVGVQIHGGMGFIEETGAAQYMRDLRITTIYEGTTGIQANDLIGRKIGRDRGAAMQALIETMRAQLDELGTSDATAQAIGKAAVEAVERLREATAALLQAHAAEPARALAVSVPYLHLCGLTAGGWLLARSAAIAVAQLHGSEREFYQGKLESARFYAQQILPRTLALASVVQHGCSSVTESDAALI